MSAERTSDFRKEEDFERSRQLLGETLHLDGPASAALTRRALDDSKFAFYLLMTKDSPSLQIKLLGNMAVSAAPTTPLPDSAALAAKAGKALLNWGLGGFRKVDEDRFARRLAACQACEFLADPPQRLVYQGINLLMSGDTKICSACGCMAAKKAALNTEACPRQDPANASMTRWGEPVIVLERTG
ncbi:hypothetical protein [Bradyrhizobium sp. CCBAU 53380]|uniref:hypothetical protein n=1 Tax=Bradyrhizobium sp. CCBAU 53380 TaxID=1325117 RepID=UPI0023023980|nr:hypothetical protein [Bradyrhizobium sp. CCBAU 53380]